jgi:hypothetical protein
MASALGNRPGAQRAPPRTERSILRHLPLAGMIAAEIAAVVAIGFPYLSVREVSSASDIRQSNPAQALRDLDTAAELNPLTAVPGRIGGAIALQSAQYSDAERRFGQAISREPRGWFAWLGAGLAASALHDPARAEHDFKVAASIISQQPAVVQALRRVDSRHPLTPAEAFNMLVLAG